MSERSRVRKMVPVDVGHMAFVRKLQRYLNMGKEPEESWRIDDILYVALKNGLDDWGEEISDEPEWERFR